MVATFIPAVSRFAAPEWVKPGALYDFDFVNNRYWGGRADGGSCLSNYQGQCIVGSGNSLPGWQPNRAGILVQTPAFFLRRTDLGLFADPQTTNQCLQSRTFTNAAWAKTNVTAAMSQVGMDGFNNTAGLITATAANGTLLQAITITSAPVLTSFYLKRVSGVGAVTITQDGTTFTDVTAQLNTAGYVRVVSGVQTLSSLSVGIQLATSGDAVAIDFAQAETSNIAGITLNGNPTTPIVTTTATVNHGIDEPAINTTGSQPNAGLLIMTNVLAYGGPWCVFAQYSGSPFNTSLAGQAGFVVASDAQIDIRGGADGGPVSFLTSITANSGNAGFGNTNKVVGRCNASGATCSLNGGALSTYASANKPVGPGSAGTHCGLGNNGGTNGPGPLNGSIQRLAFWKGELTDGQMMELSRVVNNQ